MFELISLLICCSIIEMFTLANKCSIRFTTADISRMGCRTELYSGILSTVTLYTFDISSTLTFSFVVEVLYFLDTFKYRYLAYTRLFGNKVCNIKNAFVRKISNLIHIHISSKG